MEEYGARFKARARELNLSDVEVARRLGLEQARYSRYVNGLREPDLRMFVRICSVLATTPNAILGVDAPAGDATEADRLRAQVDSTLRTMSLPALRTAVAVVNAIASTQPGAGEEG